ncbi:piggyBac transposable element-derived protein 4-like [Poecilia latipinna]|uniref:piggyBac transposable element-derived protein 4-like n=1 Tax=Poecilia latipinna TaxID=48699 RepID=UPI00072E69D6|nr:PREDICTED: piggyBac transposable element-derived protein 4-like [Poecilia latipinna]
MRAHITDSVKAAIKRTNSIPAVIPWSAGDDVEETEDEEKKDEDALVPSVEDGGRGRNGLQSLSPSNGKRSRSDIHLGQEVGWKTEQESDRLPLPAPRFLPSRRPGVQPPLSHGDRCPSPAELFKLYFNQAAIKTLCVNTNKNAAKRLSAGRTRNWTNVTEREMYQYIGLALYMRLLKRPKVRDFWRTATIFQLSHPSRVMSRDRFLSVTANVHMSDPEDDAVNDRKKGSPEYDCLHRLRPLYDSLRVACKAVYHPQQNLCVGERMVATKAKLGLKQHIKGKPATWGIKLFVLCDSTGYTVDFQVYTGGSSQASGSGLSFDAVMSLSNKAFLGSGYHIYCDSFYTSPALFSRLHELGFGACGTFRNTRVGAPKTKVNALTKRSPRGSIRWIREGPLLFIKWMDAREVSVCSTLHTAFSGDAVRRVSRAGGKHGVLEVPVPAAVKDYNRFTGAVGRSDQLIGSASWQRGRKWYVVVLQHLIDVAVTNSYLLHRELCGQRGQQALTLQAFQEQLTAQLCGEGSPSALSSSNLHLPVAIVEGASGQNKATKGRRRCRLCSKSTPFMCAACSLPLCVIVDRNCHKDFHSCSKYRL